MGAAGLKRAMALAALLALAACASPPASTPLPPLPPPPPVPAAPPAPEPATPAPADRCGARDLQYLVGRPRTEIPVPVEPGHRRVACTTCPMTRDYREDRQTILFDEASGLVTSVACN